ncbi:MAG: M90 family metallopeptidase [Pseudomonadota bacterium]
MKLLGLFLFAGAALWALLRWRRHRRVSDLLARRFTPTQRDVMARRVPLIKKLDAEERARLDGLIHRFLDQITFTGHEGLVVTDEMRITIAAQACLMLVNKPNRWFDGLYSIYLYPAAFKSRQTEHDGFVETTRTDVRLGESWEHGPVVLSWRDAEAGALLDDDGRNLVLHEFAHQLDDQTGETDGSPLLDRDHDAQAWARVFQDAFDRLTADVDAGRQSFLDPYGATNPAEFFAVAVEAYFERGDAMRREEPALHDQLARYFKL